MLKRSTSLVDKWLYALPEHERLPFSKAGNRTLIKLSDLRKFLEKNQQKWMKHPLRKARPNSAEPNCELEAVGT